MPNGGSQNEISILAYSEEVRRRKYMTVQEALNKATEGGYHIYGSDGMDTDRPRRACLSLLIAETRQHAQRLCAEAARAQQEAHAARRLAQCARQRRQSEHVERGLWREHCGVQCSTPERVLTHAFPAV